MYCAVNDALDFRASMPGGDAAIMADMRSLAKEGGASPWELHRPALGELHLGAALRPARDDQPCTPLHDREGL